MKSAINKLRSNVMKSARIIWFNNEAATWSEAVAKAWRMCKRGMIVYAKKISGKTDASVITKTWEKDGKSRVYFTLVFADRSRIELGYADLVSKKCFFSDRGYQATWAARMESAIIMA